MLRYPELNNYDGCAEFVADYLNFEPLDSSIDLVYILINIFIHNLLFMIFIKYDNTGLCV